MIFKEHEVNQKYIDYLQPLNQDVFKILESRLKKADRSLTSGKILDFGCNVGNLLKTAQGAIHPSQYTGLDINAKALEVAASEFSHYKFVHYNKFNNTFNPHGSHDLRIPLSEEFDIIVAYGVFTHFFMNDITETIKELLPFLKTDGVFLFSLWEDVDYYGYLGFLDRQLGINVTLPKPHEFKNGFVLVDRERLLIDVSESPENSFKWIEAFYRKDYVLEKIEGCRRLEGYPTYHPVYCLSHGGKNS